MSANSSARPNAEELPVQLAIALDVPDAASALRLATAVAPWFSIAKVGLELFVAEGPSIVRTLSSEGFSLFVDLKLYDIPTTVERAATALGRLGVSYATVHAAGGPAVVRACVAGLAAGAAEVGHAAPVALGVTVLTSEPDAPPSLLAERVGTLLKAGAGGLVCAASDLGTIGELAPTLLTVVPGIRPDGAEHADQARVATPLGAARAGANVLVIGRPVSHAPDPAQAAHEIADSLL